jgi:hypothetical protein
MSSEEMVKGQGWVPPPCSSLAPSYCTGKHLASAWARVHCSGQVAKCQGTGGPIACIGSKMSASHLNSAEFEQGKTQELRRKHSCSWRPS